MSYPVYNVPDGDTLVHLFGTYDGGTGASITLTGLAVTDIEIYKDGSVTQRASDSGYTLLDTDGIDFDGITGIHGFSIDLSDNTDAGFYSVGSWFHVVVSSVTVDAQTVNFVACAFRIMAAEASAGVVDANIASIDANAITATSIATGAITNAKFAANAIDAASLATDAVNEIVDQVWNELQADHVTAGSFGVLATEIADILADTADIQPKIGTPAADLAADIATVDANVDAVLADTGTDGVVLANDAITAAKIATDAIGSDEFAASAAQKIRDEILPTQNAAFSNIEFLFVAASDHVTPVTGATGTAVTRSIDGGAFGSGTGTLAEVGNGIYQYDASAADMNGGIITFRFTASGGTPGAPDDRFLTIVTGGGV